MFLWGLSLSFGELIPLQYHRKVRLSYCLHFVNDDERRSEMSLPFRNNNFVYPPVKKRNRKFHFVQKDWKSSGLKFDFNFDSAIFSFRSKTIVILCSISKSTLVYRGWNEMLHYTECFTKWFPSFRQMKFTTGDVYFYLFEPGVVQRLWELYCS